MWLLGSKLSRPVPQLSTLVWATSAHQLAAAWQDSTYLSDCLSHSSAPLHCKLCSPAV